MNKPLDDWFEQTRQSLRAELPLEHIAERLAAAPKSRFWTFKKIIGMNSLLFSLLAAFATWWSLSTPTVEVLASTQTLPTWVVEAQAPSNTSVLLDTPPPAPRPPVTPVPPVPPPPPVPPVPPAPPVPPVPPVAPQKTFTEYTLEIRKENSEQQLRKLQKELGQYGIQMTIDKLTYAPDQTIQRFKGRFDTDSLFCGEQISQHEFDVSGAFNSMQFTFRVAEENNQLKYLKIAMDDEVEQTIECYDDEVISNAEEARRLHEVYRLKNYEVQLEMEEAAQRSARIEQELARANQAVVRAQARISRLNLDSVRILQLSHLSNKELGMDELNELLKDIDQDMEILLADVKLDTADLHERLRATSQQLDLELEDLEITVMDLDQLTREIEAQMEQETVRIIELEEEVADEAIRLELKLQGEAKANDAEALKQQAKALEKAAKTLQKEAKKMTKEAKRKAKEAKRKARQKRTAAPYDESR